MPNILLTEDSENPWVEIKGELNGRKSLLIGITCGVLVYLILLLSAYLWLRNRRMKAPNTHGEEVELKEDNYGEIVEGDGGKAEAGMVDEKSEQLAEPNISAKKPEEKKKEETILRMAVFGGVKLVVNTIMCFYFTREWTDCGHKGSDPSKYTMCTETGGSCTLPDFFQNCEEDLCSEVASSEVIFTLTSQNIANV